MGNRDDVGAIDPPADVTATEPELDLSAFFSDEPLGHTGSLGVRCFGATDIGPKRKSNEDDFLIAELAGQVKVHQAKAPRPGVLASEEKAFLMVVADGMGGHAGGTVASLLAIGEVKAVLMNLLPRLCRATHSAAEEICAELRNAVTRADGRVIEESERDPHVLGMGCTLTLGLIAYSTLYVAHVGDSRCYHWRQGSLTRLTEDHTVAEELLRQGEISAEEAKSHKGKRFLVNAVGGSTLGVRVDLHAQDIEAGDAVLFCTDGLTGVITDREIAEILQTPPPKEACQRLLALALERETTDNVTAIVARLDSV